MDALAPMMTLAALVALRFFVAMRLIPFIGEQPLPISVCGGLAVALSVFFFPLADVSALFDIRWFGLTLLAAKEALIGVVLGAAARFCFLGLRVAGGIVDISALPLVSPGETPLFQKLFFFLGVGVYLLSGGHHALCLAFSGSLRQVTVAAPVIIADSLWSGSAGAAVNLFSSAFVFGVLVAAPVFVAAMISEIMLQMVRRMLRSASSDTWTLVRTVMVQVVILVFLWTSVELLVTFMRESMATVGGPR